MMYSHTHDLQGVVAALQLSTGGATRASMMLQKSCRSPLQRHAIQL